MSSLSNLSGTEILPGFSQELPLVFGPVVILLDKEDMRGLIKQLKNSDSDVKIRRGVYILAATERNSLGKYNVTVGQSGVDGEKQKLIERVKYHVSKPPRGMEKWNKAILVCDWENDILAGAKGGSKQKSSKNNKEILLKTMKSEVHFLESMLHSELKKYDDEIGSLSVQRDEGGINKLMLNPDLRRYEYYVECVMKILGDIASGFMDPPREKKKMQIRDYLKAGLLEVGDNIYGRFDSAGKILDLQGNSLIREFAIGNKKAPKSELDKLSNVSLYQALAYIRKANNASGNISAPDFWYVSRSDDRIRISDLRKL